MDLAVRPPAEVPFSRRCLASSAPNLSWLLGVIWGGGGGNLIIIELVCGLLHNILNPKP